MEDLKADKQDEPKQEPGAQAPGVAQGQNSVRRCPEFKAELFGDSLEGIDVDECLKGLQGFGLSVDFVPNPGDLEGITGKCDLLGQSPRPETTKLARRALFLPGDFEGIFYKHVNFHSCLLL